MTTALKLIRLFTASTVGFISCVFVSLYCEFSASMFNHMQYASLPVATICVHHLSRYFYAIPTAFLVSDIFLLRSGKEREILIESIIALGWIFAFGWPLVALLAWQLPHIPYME
jgi:hypothetical protein